MDVSLPWQSGSLAGQTASEMLPDKNNGLQGRHVSYDRVCRVLKITTLQKTLGR